MNEWKRIFSHPKRRLAFLCIPLLCFVLFFYQKGQGDFGALFTQSRDYRALLKTYAQYTPAQIAEDLSANFPDTENEQRLLAQAEHVRDYGAYLERVQKQAAQMGATSIFGAEKGTFTYRNILKTAQDFAHCTAQGVRLGNDRAVEDWLQFSIGDWAFLGVILLLVMSFLEEKQKGLSAIIRSCPAGRWKLQASRLGVLLVFSAAMTLLLSALPLVVSLCLDGGWEDLSRPVQSVAAFLKCTQQLSILGFLGQFFLVKTACGFLLGVLMWFLLSFLNRPQMGWLAAGVGLAVEYLLYTFIPAQSILSPFREINVFSYVFPRGLYTQYTNINFFGFPMGRQAFLMGLLLLGAAALGSATLLVLTRRYPFGNRDLLGKWVHRWNRAGDWLRRPLGVYGFELYKFLFIGMGGLFLILGLLLTRDLNFHTDAYLEAEDRIYRQYAQEIQGPITQDTYDYLAQARAALENSALDTSEYEIALDRIEADIAGLDTGAWFVYQPMFLNCYGTKSAFPQRQNGLLAYIFLVACLSVLYAGDQQGDVRKVLCTTPRGRGRLFWTKYAVAITVTLLVWLRVFGQEWRLSLAYLGQVLTAAPSSSIFLIAHFPTTVGGTLAIFYLFKLVGLLIPANLCVFLAEWCKTYEKALLLGGLILLIPAAAYYFGTDALAFFTPVSFLADGSPLFHGAGNIPAFVLWFLLSWAALYFAKRGWCRPSA